MLRRHRRGHWFKSNTAHQKQLFYFWSLPLATRLQESDSIAMNLKNTLETGYLKTGLPYAKLGNQPGIILNIEALSMNHKPPSGISLRQFATQHQLLAKYYSVYLVGRKPNMPDHYYMADMAKDYALAIHRQWSKPVHVMGISTGGQIGQYLAAGYPQLVHKLVIISSAFRLSQKGKEIEGRAASYFKQEKYGKAMSALMELVLTPGLKTKLIQPMVQIMGNIACKNLPFPQDFLLEVRADREMDFSQGLKDIKAPTLVLGGDKDIAYSLPDIKTTAENIANSKLIIYKGHGHGLPMANSVQIQKDIYEFLKD